MKQKNELLVTLFRLRDKTEIKQWALGTCEMSLLPFSHVVSITGR
ncbi:MAG: hypothetical protein V1855_02915 [bacterium]